MFEKIQYQQIEHLIVRMGFPKISFHIEGRIMSKLPDDKLGWAFRENSNNNIYWHRIPGYFIKAVDFIRISPVTEMEQKNQKIIKFSVCEIEN